MKIFKRNLNFGSFLLVLILQLLFSCKKSVDVNVPPNAIDASVAYTKDADATKVLNGIYTNMMNSDFSGTGSLSIYCGLSADEYTSYPASGDFDNACYQNSLVSNPTTYAIPAWGIYRSGFLYTTNSAIQGLSSSSTLTPAVKQQLLGEAKFCRAFFYFYLSNLFGDVPMPLTNNYQVNQSLARTPQKQVYQQIIQDLTDAQGLLSKNFVGLDLQTTTTERVRPTYWAATALLARVYLYYGNLTNNADGKDYQNAVNLATTVIDNNGGLFSLATLDNVFLKNSSEAIWEIQPTSMGFDVQDANTFVLTTSPNNTYAQVAISPNLLSAFETGDQRFSHWVGLYTDSTVTPYVNYYYPYKYKNYQYNADLTVGSMTEYLEMLRLGELYLIRAEAKNDLGDPSAVNDLNSIRNRAGLLNYSGATDQTSLAMAIMHERQVELFSEFGHRWLDLKRTGLYKSVMPSVCQQKGGSWKDSKALYPIPASEILIDKNLTQNPGY